MRIHSSIKGSKAVIKVKLPFSLADDSEAKELARSLEDVIHEMVSKTHHEIRKVLKKRK